MKTKTFTPSHTDRRTATRPSANPEGIPAFSQGLTAALLGLALLARPGLARAQGTYLSAPDGNPTNALVVAPGGNIGIGISSPVRQLHLSSPVGGNTFISLEKADESTQSGIEFRSGGASKWLFWTDNLNGGDLKITATGLPGEDSETPRVWLPDDSKNILLASSGGNVGIGSTDPTEKLDILNGNLVLGGAHQGNNNYGSIKFRSPSGGESINLRSAVSGAFGSSGNRDALAIDLPFDESSTFEVVRNLVGPVFAVRATGQTLIGGYVGIRTALPEDAIHIVQTEPTGVRWERQGYDTYRIGNIGPGFSVHDVTDNRYDLVFDGTGNVGVGTTSPQARLDVNGKINCTVLELTSDRNQKQDFAAVNPRNVLDRLVDLPIQTWAYTNDAHVRHLGPMAQDWKATYPELGSDDKHIAPSDLASVALVGLQGLNAKLTESLKEKDAEITALKKELIALKTDHADFAARFEKLEKVIAHAAPGFGVPASAGSATTDSEDAGSSSALPAKAGTPNGDAR